MALDGKKLLAVAIPYLALEAAWLSFMVPRVYSPLYSRVQGGDEWHMKSRAQTIVGAVLAYTLLTWGIAFFALPGDPSHATDAESALRGAALGLLVYGTYNLTNYVVLRDWGVLPCLIDTAWGVAVTATTAVAARRLLLTFQGR
jgi:uncharacterized membrane protein